MNARSLTLAATVSLLLCTAGALSVAPAALAEEPCPNTAARRGPAVALPDCRAYEQVTPLNKGDSTDIFGSIDTNESTGTPSDDDNHYLFETDASYAGGDTVRSGYVFSRGADGWTPTSLSTAPGVNNQQIALFNPADFSEVALEDLQFNRLPGQQEERTYVDFSGPAGGPYTSIDTQPYEGNPGASMVGASADMSHIVLETEQHELAPGDTGQDPEGGYALYEDFNGRLRLINVATDGSLISPCGAVLGMGNGAESRTNNAVSSDGSRIFFTAPDPGNEFGSKPIAGPGCWNTTTEEDAPQLYMRLNGASTVEVSAPNQHVADPGGPRAAVFLSASADGSKVFFMSEGELTTGDPGHDPELYEYEAGAPEGQKLTRVSGGKAGTAEGNVDFVGAVSADGSEVYFGAFGDLAEGASALIPGGGVVNFYRYDTVTKETTYIAELPANSYYRGETFVVWYDGGGLKTLQEHGAPQISLLASGANWYATGNGEYLLFASPVSLTGYENAGKEELFRYSAAEKSIVCVSCAGGPPVGNARFSSNSLEGARDAKPSRPISEDGSFVFFETFNALVPNTTDKVQHVYEWHDGRISLISTPDDQSNAFFLGSTPDGSNVFFGTHAQLVSQDTDVAGDVYDARVDGGFVGVTPPQCTGSGCQGVPAAPPIFATPSSVTFEGVGNFPSVSATPADQKKSKATKKRSTRAEKLAKALKSCARARSKLKRARCKARAEARNKTHTSNKSNRRGN
jgi:hypothetical protein